MRTLLAATVSLLVMASGVAGAQPMSVERKRVLSIVGEVLDRNIPLEPLQPGPGRVFRQAISAPATSALRLHFTVESQPAEQSWHVEVVAQNGTRQRYRPEAGERDFWSREVPGNSATVEIFSTAASLPLKMAVDRIAIAKPPVKPKAIVGPDQRELYRQQAEPIRTLGRSVMRLRFVDDVQKSVFVCTGFLVFTSAHVLTNEHCINSVPEMHSALADFDFDGGGATPQSVGFRRLLMSDGPLDFSLLELEQAADRSALTIGTPPSTEKQALVVIEHPGGEVKQVSIRDCAIKGVQVSGTTDATTDFGHTCDTLGGSSGSPVFDPASFVVVGLHHLGFLEGDPAAVNRAVQIARVIEAIGKKFPDLVKPKP